MRRRATTGSQVDLFCFILIHERLTAHLRKRTNGSWIDRRAGLSIAAGLTAFCWIAPALALSPRDSSPCIYAKSLPTALTVTPDGKKVYVADFVGNRVIVVSPDSNTIEKVLPVPGSAKSVVLSPNGKAAFVVVNTVERSSLVTINVNDNQIIASRPLSSGWYDDILISRDGATAFLVRISHAAVVRMDLASFKSKASSPIPEIYGMAYDPVTGRLFVASEQMEELDSTSLRVVRTIKLGGEPERVAISPDGKMIAAIVPKWRDGSVYLMNSQIDAVAARIPVGSLLSDAVFSLDGDELYVSSQVVGNGIRTYETSTGEARASGAPGTISIIDIRKRRVLSTINVGLGPHRIALSPDGKKLYTIAYDRSLKPSLALVDLTTRTVTARIPIPLPAQALGANNLHTCF